MRKKYRRGKSDTFTAREGMEKGVKLLVSISVAMHTITPIQVIKMIINTIIHLYRPYTNSVVSLLVSVT